MATIKRIVRSIVFATVFFGILAAWSGFSIPVEVRERIVYREPLKPSIDDLMQTIPAKYNIPPILARAIMEQESGGKRDAIRYEPGQRDRAKKAGAKTEGDIMALASSHGLLQIMGWHAPRYNISWSDLYDPETNVEVGMAILRDCLDRKRASKKYDWYFQALACYNGSEVYAKHVMEGVSRRLVEDAL